MSAKPTDIAMKKTASRHVRRHNTKDLMTSFYAKSPSSFMVECGWGGPRSIRRTDPVRECKMTARACGATSASWLSPEDPRHRPRHAHSAPLPRASARPWQVIEGNFKPDVGRVPMVGDGCGTRLITLSRSTTCSPDEAKRSPG